MTKVWAEKQKAVSLVCGSLSVDERMDQLNRFRSGATKVLFATDLLARSLDVPDIKIVVNFDLALSSPNTACRKVFLHRICRAGRFGKRGIAISLLEQGSISSYKGVANHYGFTPNPILFRHTES